MAFRTGFYRGTFQLGRTGGSRSVYSPFLAFVSARASQPYFLCPQDGFGNLKPKCDLEFIVMEGALVSLSTRWVW